MATKDKTLVELLAEVQAELKAPKGQRNSFGKYNYRSAEDIVEAVKPLLNKRGLILNISDEMVQVGDRYYIKATSAVYDKERDCIEAVGYAREALSQAGMSEGQVTGTTSSYARKYSLNGLFAIDDNKDLDSDEHQANNKKDDSAPKTTSTTTSNAPKSTTSGKTPTTKKESIKPPLNLGTESFKKACDAVKNKTYTVEQIKGMYSLTPQVEAELNKIV